ncbi:TPA: hypothetical protein DIV55_06500 [Patescibacteria group bacterium]|uniref:Uncharacterized protein n=1 Tax=Candidatus Curtissbacteria bacterium GW2011_GWA1_40_16 TaxID=1618405 RepID=A0A0G0RDU4_9BACT|nr:MAG: hypothetical protein UT84_C0005G0030 [Candidatus Curtissbacteria bacterium GW2011_GWA1_40_16]HCS79354.1 hypothetical protein [Patescibacteria group bacterium]
MRVDDERRNTHPNRAGRVVLAATVAATAWFFVPHNKVNLGIFGDSGQQDNPAATDQINRELGQLKIGDQVLSITKYEESPAENDPSKKEVLIYGKSESDPRNVMDESWKLFISSKDGQFPAVMDVYPPAVEAGVSADSSGFSYDLVFRATITSGTQTYSLTALHKIGDEALQSQSVLIGQAGGASQKRN